MYFKGRTQPHVPTADITPEPPTVCYSHEGEGDFTSTRSVYTRYQRALNAVKLERVFAKPFVGALDGHSDGVFSLAKHPKRLSWLLSGACDGELKLWDLSTKSCLSSWDLHRGFVQGICVTPDGNRFITVGQDKNIRIGKIDADSITVETSQREEALTIPHTNFFTGVDHHRRQDMFATCGNAVDLWSLARSEPLSTLTWGADTVTTVKFSPVEVNIMATAADDRNIVLYDCRAATPIRKIIMAMRTNAIAWNPMEGFHFTVANEDHNLYTYDMRKLSRATNVHKDHVSAVLDLDYSPTGKEFVTGAYDRSMRIYGYNQGHSREIYHTKRMQRIFCVQWSSDAKYVMSGSDEMQIRLWKANASEAMGTQSARQRAATTYGDSLKERFKHHPEIKRISRHRHVPKQIYTAKQLKATMENAAKKKVENARRSKSTKKDIPYKPERKKHIIDEIK